MPSPDGLWDPLASRDGHLRARPLAGLGPGPRGRPLPNIAVRGAPAATPQGVLGGAGFEAPSRGPTVVGGGPACVGAPWVWVEALEPARGAGRGPSGARRGRARSACVRSLRRAAATNRVLRDRGRVRAPAGMSGRVGTSAGRRRAAWGAPDRPRGRAVGRDACSRKSRRGPECQALTGARTAREHARRCRRRRPAGRHSTPRRRSSRGSPRSCGSIASSATRAPKKSSRLGGTRG